MKRLTLTQEIMKKITLNVVKGLLGIVLFIGSTNVSNAAGPGRFKNQESGQIKKADASPASVQQKLEKEGYLVNDVYQVGPNKWKANVVDNNGVEKEVEVNPNSNGIIGQMDSSL